MASLTVVIQLLTQDIADHGMTLSVVLLGCALVWFVLVASRLFVIDVRTHRLPNRLTAALVAGGGVLLLAGTLTASPASVLADRWVMTLIGALGYCAMMLLLHLLTKAGIGMGDVKLAAGLGLYTGFLSVDALIAGFVLAFLFGGFQAVFLIVFRKATRTTRIAFGPAMLLAAAVVMVI